MFSTLRPLALTAPPSNALGSRGRLVGPIILTQRFLGFLRCKNLAGFALSLREYLWVASLITDHFSKMHEG